MKKIEAKQLTLAIVTAKSKNMNNKINTINKINTNNKINMNHKKLIQAINLVNTVKKFCIKLNLSIMICSNK
jgi:hypothetical protein